MDAILVVFDGRYGESVEIAEHVAERARDRGFRAKLLHIGLARAVDLVPYAAAVVIAPVWFGRHSHAIDTFMRRRRDPLSARRTAFVSVDPARRTQAERRARAFVERTGVRPDVVTTIDGALAHPRGPLWLRALARLHAMRIGAPTTDWASLDRALAVVLERRQSPMTEGERSKRPVRPANIVPYQRRSDSRHGNTSRP